MRRAEGSEAHPQSQPVRADMPGALDHASGAMDTFDAALVRGAGEASDVTVEADDAPLEREEEHAESSLEALPDELQDDELEAAGGGDDGGFGDGGAGDGSGGAGDGAGAHLPGAPLQGGNRAVAFLRASWAELQRVQWPDRRQVVQATAVVIGFVAVASAYLGVADFVAKEIVEFIL